MIDYYNVDAKHVHDKLKCYRALMLIYINNQQYELMLPMLEEMITHYIHQGLTQSSADEYLLSYFVIHYHVNGHDVENKLDKLIQHYPHYKNKPIYTWMIELVHTTNQDVFDKKVNKQHLEPWQKQLLSYKIIPHQDDDIDDGEDLR